MCVILSHSDGHRGFTCTLIYIMLELTRVEYLSRYFSTHRIVVLAIGKYFVIINFFLCLFHISFMIITYLLDYYFLESLRM